ncbi:MAG: hypothetical protein OXD54_18100 [Candidatus Poribacteria bacterium]|nr:hypothetical protein [Candidatus Poribacteria bacterium]
MKIVYNRPYRPIDLNISQIEGFPLNSMGDQLMVEAESATSGRASLTLARGDEMTVVLVAMKSGMTLEEHSAPGAATVVTLSGNILFSTKTKNITLTQTESVAFTSDINHSVHANEDSVFLIIIGGKHSE